MQSWVGIRPDLPKQANPAIFLSCASSHRSPVTDRIGLSHYTIVFGEKAVPRHVGYRYRRSRKRSFRPPSARRSVIRFGGGRGAFFKLNEQQESGSVNAAPNDRIWVLHRLRRSAAWRSSTCLPVPRILPLADRRAVWRRNINALARGKIRSGICLRPSRVSFARDHIEASRIVSIATNVDVLATCGRLEIRSPSTTR